MLPPTKALYYPTPMANEDMPVSPQGVPTRGALYAGPRVRAEARSLEEP